MGSKNKLTSTYSITPLRNIGHMANYTFLNPYDQTCHALYNYIGAIYKFKMATVYHVYARENKKHLKSITN